MKFTTFYCDENDEEIDVDVYYTFYMGCRGARDSLGGVRGAGPPLEPDDEPEIEINKIINTKTKEEVELTDRDTDLLLEKCWEHLNNSYE
jgi:hypothetical protein